MHSSGWHPGNEYCPMLAVSTPTSRRTCTLIIVQDLNTLMPSSSLLPRNLRQITDLRITEDISAKNPASSCLDCCLLTEILCHNRISQAVWHCDVWDDQSMFTWEVCKRYTKCEGFCFLNRLCLLNIFPSSRCLNSLKTCYTDGIITTFLQELSCGWHLFETFPASAFCTVRIFLNDADMNQPGWSIAELPLVWE